MAPQPPTILSLKGSFLANQTRHLSQPLSPSRHWHSANAAAADGIPEKALDDALFRLNHALQQHARRVYAPQATRHVAEQIDQLYWNAGDRAAAEGAAGAAEGLDAGLDPTNSETINSLPTTWESERDVHAHPMEARRYSELVARLQALDAARARAQETSLRLRQMADLLRPFQASGDDDGAGTGAGVQENLVTRDGEVERELERMRMLLARVGARLGHLREQPADAASGVGGGGGGGGGGSSSLFRAEVDAVLVDDVEVDERRKVNDLLNRF